MNSKGFTLIELIVVIAIIAILSGVVLLGVTKYINIWKDSSLKGNLSVLITDGETFYNNNGNSYNAGTDATNFCKSNAVNNAWAQISNEPDISDENCNPTPDGTAWAACAQEFSNTSNYYCVDSTGAHEEVCGSSCSGSLTQCPLPANTGC